jgi:hypothetical protein
MERSKMAIFQVTEQISPLVDMTKRNAGDLHFRIDAHSAELVPPGGKRLEAREMGFSL